MEVNERLHLFSLLSLPRGATTFALVTALVQGVADTVEALAALVQRAAREVRRCLASALSCGEISPDIAAKIRPLLEPKRRKTAGAGRKTAALPHVCARDPFSSETEIETERDSHANSQPDRIELQDAPPDVVPPPVRASLVRAALRAAGMVANFSAWELSNIERHLRNVSVPKVAAIAKRYAADTQATTRAQSLAAIFLQNWPKYLDAENAGVPVGTPACELTPKVAGRPVTTPTPTPAPAAKTTPTTAPAAARQQTLQAWQDAWRATHDGLLRAGVPHMVLKYMHIPFLEWNPLPTQSRDGVNRAFVALLRAELSAEYEWLAAELDTLQGVPSWFVAPYPEELALACA